jgi:hypothetical protein
LLRSHELRYPGHAEPAVCGSLLLLLLLLLLVVLAAAL